MLYVDDARWAPASCMVLVTPTMRSPLRARETSRGLSPTSFDQSATMAGTSARIISGPGTDADALAISEARAPAARAALSVNVGVAKNPHDEPIRARTPTPAVSCWRSASI